MNSCVCICLVNQLDYFLSSHIDSIRSICPIVDRTSDELIEYYGDQFHLSFMNKNSISSSIANNIKNIHKEKRLQFFQSYFQFLTNILIIIEIYSKSIRNELHSYIDVSRNIWKNMNMVDGRTLDEVEVNLDILIYHMISYLENETRSFY